MQIFPKPYWKVDTVSSRDEFELMEQFTNYEIAKPLQSRLLTILGQSKPFPHFKRAIGRSDTYRQIWYAFAINKKWIGGSIN